MTFKRDWIFGRTDNVYRSNELLYIRPLRIKVRASEANAIVLHRAMKWALSHSDDREDCPNCIVLAKGEQEDQHEYTLSPIFMTHRVFSLCLIIVSSATMPLLSLTHGLIVESHGQGLL
jgi:hypothetical protein